MTPEDDLPILAEQEARLHFRGFDPGIAWQLGSSLRGKLLARVAAGSVEIELAGHVWFTSITPGANPGQANWIRRKRNTVHHFARSTYAVGRRLEREGATLTGKHGLSEADFVAHGSGFPIVLAGTGAVGTVVVSGLPQRDDHNLAVDALAEVLGVDIPRLV